MLLSRLSACLLALSPSLAAALMPYPRTPHPFNRRSKSSESITWNGYGIVLCGDVHDPNSKANKALSFLYAMQQELEKLITDAQLGTRSQHGFTAFFKSNRNIARVVAAYRNIADGNPVIVSEARAASLGDRTPQPVFMCINEGDAMTAHVMEQCKQRSAEPVFIKPGVEGVMLCPRFFDVGHFKDNPQPCPDLGPDGKFRAGDLSLLHGTYAYVVHMLIRMYDRTATENVRGAETMQDAVELTSSESLRSAVNYGYYAGAVFSKFPTQDLLSIRLNLFALLAMSLEVDRRHEAPIAQQAQLQPYRYESEKESQGYNLVDNASRDGVPVQQRSPRTVLLLAITLAITVALAVIAAGVSGSMAIKRKHDINHLTAKLDSSDKALEQCISQNNTESPTSNNTVLPSTNATDASPIGPASNCTDIGDGKKYVSAWTKQIFTVQCETDFAGSDILGIWMFTFADCMEACASWNYHMDSKSRCYAVSYDYSNQDAFTERGGMGNCFLKGSDGVSAKTRNVTSSGVAFFDS